MNKFQDNSVRMLTAVHEMLLKHEGAWSGNLAVERSLDSLGYLLVQIKGSSMKQRHATKGASRTSLALKESLLQEVLSLCGILNAFGLSTGNEVLVALGDYTWAELSIVRQTELADISESLYNKAEEFLPELEEFGYDSSAHDQLGTLIGDFRSAVSGQRVSKGTQVAATQSISRILKEAKGVASKGLDKQMRRYQKSNPEFYAAYKAVRKIVDLGIRHEEGGVSAADAA